MAATYGRAFVFGIPTQKELLDIQSTLMADHMIVSKEDFLKVVRDGDQYAVEKLENGYSAFLIYKR